MAEAAAAYRAILGSSVRSQTAYRSSLVVDLVGSLGATAISFAEIAVIFTNVKALGGLTFTRALTVFAIAQVCFTLADMFVGHLNDLPTYVRTGALDAYLLRPLPVLAQFALGDVALRRLGRTAAGLVLLVIALSMNRVEWTSTKVLLLVLTLVSGTTVFAALFVCGGAIQFWLIDGFEFAAAFTYGANYASQYPTSVFMLPLRLLLTYVVPAAFVAYLPTLVLFDLPGPAGLPQWLGWCVPLVAAAAWTGALAVWRAGLRHYTGAGS